MLQHRANASKQSGRKMLAAGKGKLKFQQPHFRRGLSVEPLESRLALTPAIIVGSHTLLPNTANQEIDINVSGGQAVQGVDLNAQVADGGPPAGGIDVGPTITGNLIAGTIFNGNNTGDTDPGSVPMGYYHSTTTASGTVSANGLLVRLFINTTGFGASSPGDLGPGHWSLSMFNTANGPTDFGSVQAAITDGSITIDQAPTINNVSPTSMPASSSNQTLTINGANFQNGATLTFVPNGGTPIASIASKLTFVSSSQITYQFNNGNVSGPWTVQVNNPDGSSSGQLNFNVVNLVNHAPSFTVGSDQVVSENSPAHTITNWASNISAGPTNESGQAVAFQVTANNPNLFSVQPAINSSGDLSYTLASNAFGITGVTVVLKDNGGTNNGGIDMSALQMFSIAVVSGAPYQNQTSPFDVNSDHSFSANDVLNVINELLDHPAPDILPTVPPVPPTLFVDVNGDGRATAQDVLLVINNLLAHPVPGASPNGTTPLASVNGSETQAPAASSGGASVASALAASATSTPSSSLAPNSAWALNRLSHVDLNSGPVAKYLEHLAEEDTATSRAILVKADQVTDALNLDDELLDGLLVKLGS